MPELAARLAADRAAAEQQLNALRRDHAAMVAASEASNADDEHDPEGATIGYERALLATLITRQEQRIHELDQAQDALRKGTYGVCERCSEPIGPERLAARPAASLCIACAH